MTKIHYPTEQLYRLTIVLGTTLDLAYETAAFMTWLREVVEPELAALFLTDEAKQELRLAGALGFQPPAEPCLLMGLDLWRWLADQEIAVPEEGDPRRYAVPISIEKQIFGTLCVVSHRWADELAEEQRLVQTATGHLASILRNIHRYQTLEQRVAQRTAALSALNAVTTAVSQSLDLKETMTVALDATLEALRFEVGGIALWNEEERRLERLVTRGVEPELATAFLSPLRAGGNRERVLRTGQPVFHDDTAHDPTVNPEIARHGFTLAAMVPLLHTGKVLGILAVATRAPRRWTEEDKILLTAIGRQVAVALANAQLYEEVRESERKLREAQRLGRIGHWEFDLQTRQIQWSDMVYTIYERDPRLGPPTVEEEASYYSPEDAARLRQLAMRAVETGEPYEVEVRVNLPGGRHAWVVATGIPIRNAEGHVVRLLGTVQDITTRKQTEERLASLLRFQNEMLDTAAIWINILDAEGNVTFWNRAAERISGYSREEVLGHAKIWEWLYPDPEYRNKIFARAMEITQKGKRDENFETVIRRKDGEYRVISWHSNNLVDEDGRIVGSIALGADVTERKRAEDAVRRRAEELAALQATVLDIIAPHDLTTLLQTIVERAAQLLHAPGGVIYLCDQDRQEVRCVVRYNTPRDCTGTVLKYGEGAAGIVAQTGQPLIIEDYRTWSGRAAVYEEKEQPFRAVLSAPMIWQGQVIGVIHVLHYEEGRHFTEADLELLTLFANHAAIAIENARLLEETRHRAAEAAALFHTSLALTTLDLDNTLRTIGEHAKALFAADGCRVFLLEPDGETLRCVLALHQRAEAVMAMRLKLGQGVTGDVARRGEAEIVNDMLADPRSVQVPGTPVEREAMMFAPLKERERVIGVMSVSRLGDERPFHPADLELLKAFASMASSAISNARLFEETRRHLSELETLQTLSSALRQAQTVEEMVPVFVRHAVQAVGAQAGSIYLLEEASGDWVSFGWFTPEGEWVSNMKRELRHHPGEGLTGKVGASGEIYITADLSTEEAGVILPGERNLLKGMCTGISLPLRAEERPIGVLHVFYSRSHTFTQEEQRLLMAIADMAGSALQRARLHEETRRHLEQLQALHNIDMAIAASMDLRVTFAVLLEHVTNQLGADAAGVLLLNHETLRLEYAAGCGFRTQAYVHCSVRLGDGLAGRVALERRAISTDDPAQIKVSNPEFAALWAKEGFVAYYGLPLIAKGEVKGVLELFHRVPFTVDAERARFLSTMASQAAIAIDNVQLFEGLQRANVELNLAYDTTLEGWARAMELRDQETEGHTRRVTEMALRLARAMGMSEGELVHVRRGALLHDIGKMGIPDTLLLKPGPLSSEEWQVMQQHPVYAYELLSPISFLRPALDIPYCHHEKWDGTGYPRGLKGEQIPLAARIFAVVDVWDALTSDRPYRLAWSREQALAYIKEQAGKHFDPRVVEAFLALIEGQQSPP